MSSRDFADNLQQQARTIGLEKISQLITAYQKQNEPVEDGALIQWFMYAPEIDLHDATIVLGVPNFVEPVDHDGYGLLGYRKNIPDLVDAYDLVHDDTNATLITFPKPGITEFESPNIGVKFSGAARTPGTEYQIITDDPDLNPTDRIGFAGWMYIPSAVTVGSDQYLIHKDDAQYNIKLTSKTNMRFTVTRSGGDVSIDITVPNDAWFSWGFSYDSTNGFKSYINKTQATQAQTGAIVVTATNLGIWGRAAGAALLENTIALSGIDILHSELNQTWMNSYHDDGILDHDTDASGLIEITFLPYIDSLIAMPNAFAGMFIGS